MPSPSSTIADIQNLGPEALRKIKAELARRSLAEYTKQMWPIIEPGAPLVWGWVPDAICDHLQAVAEGHIKRLVINVPPGPMRHDSIVTTSEGRKLLSEIRVGDMVLTHKGRYRPVSAVHHQGVLPILRIETYSGRVTHAAPTHPYLTPDGWIPASDLVIGDKATIIANPHDRRHDCIVSITPDVPAECMCLTVDEDHSFTCSDIAVKNSMKSKLTAVAMPTWLWTFKPHHKFLTSSYALSLAERNNIECRRVIQSKWYNDGFGISISPEEGGKVNFSTTSLGAARAISVGGQTTGYRGDVFIIDDPHDVTKAESDAKRAEAVQWFVESAQTRLNSLVESSIIVVMQRVHEEDVTAVALEMGYDHLCIPMRWDEAYRKVTSIGWTDPRTTTGALMWPERFPATELDSLERNMGPYAVASQMQQHPAPRKGGLFAVDRLIEMDDLPSDDTYSFVRAWDLAGSEGSGAYSVGVLMAYGHTRKRYYVCDVVRGQWGGGKVRQKVNDTADVDGVETAIVLPQDPGQAGKVLVEDMIAGLAGYNARAEIQSGSKETRAEPFAAQVEVGNVVVLNRTWKKAFVDELRFFPKGKFKDQVDASASAFNKLSSNIRKRKRTSSLAMAGEKQDNLARLVG